MQFIGKAVQERMNVLNMDAKELASRAFIDETHIQAIINNEVALNDIDEFDFAFICSALHCNTEFFINESIRQKDLLTNVMNSGKSDEKFIKAVAKIQDFINDFNFINEVLLEGKVKTIKIMKPLVSISKE